MDQKGKADKAGGARAMGRTDLIASRLGYGAMELSGPPKARDIPEADAIRFLNQIVDAGVTYIDTSIDYGLSEVLIGKALSHRRGDFLLASKCACEVGVDPYAPHDGHKHEKHIYSGENVIAGVEQSLKRLRTDHLDVVQVHGNPTRKELEDGGVVDALLKLKQKGAVRHIGISSRLPLLAEFVDVDYFTVVQVPYSALQRTNEDAITALRASGKAIVARGVTGRGAPAKGWATRPIGTADGEVRDVWEKAGLDDLLEGMSRIEFMIRFVLANDNVDVALVATTNHDHLLADIGYAAKGALPADVAEEARRRLLAAGCGPGLGKYKGGGPTPVP
ncbi:MAG: aldo/keto reductase [Beijerinckiaceae bacterium]|nr:aldo/keto reductase [Beijerinckiaceae bacterium]